LAWLAALALTCSTPVSGESRPPEADPDLAARLRTILLGGSGAPLLCPRCPEESPIRVDVASGQATEVSLPYQAVNDLVAFPDGKRLLAATSSDKGKRSLLLVLSKETLAPLGRVEIPGNGERVVVGPDGYAAYVLSRRPERSEPENPESGSRVLLEVDLGASAVTSAYPLDGIARDLTLTPSGRRLFVALDDRILTFTTSPLTASWLYRSPGQNRALSVRPGKNQLYVLRDSSVAVFGAEPRKEGPSSEKSPDDDALWVLESPTRVDRVGFSPDGRLAVAAGRALDQLVVVDPEGPRIVGTWPQDTGPILEQLRAVDAAARPRGPRGKLTEERAGFSPPLGPPPPPGYPPALPGTPSRRGVQAPAPPGPPVPSAPAGNPQSVPASPSRAGEEQRSAAGAAPPPAASAVPSGRGATLESPPNPGSDSDTGALEEVADPILAGTILGDATLVKEILLFGPDSLTLLHDRTTPAVDGTFSFPLPPKGRYRLLLEGGPTRHLKCRPPFFSLEIGEYGYRGIQFRVLGAVANSGR
jgi:hypothetical protein